MLAILIAAGVPAPAGAHEFRISGGGVAREEALLPVNETRPAGRFSFGARLGVETAIGAGWRGGVFGQWPRSRFRVDQGTSEVEESVRTWSAQLATTRAFRVGRSSAIFLGPVLEYGESTSRVDTGSTSLEGPQSHHWSGGIRVGADVEVLSSLMLQVEYVRLVGGARATLANPAIGTSWNADSADFMVGLSWSFEVR